jgi:aromatic ring hydroxylase
MRTGADYRAALRDGRRVWVLGEGRVADVTTHPATRGMVEEYVRWYDRHLDPAWQEALLVPADADGNRRPWAYVLPKSAADLIGMGQSYAKTIFESAGNITHTPAYGSLIALGVLHATEEYGAAPRQIAEAAAYRDMIAASGRFLTFCGGAAPIGHRLHPDPAERVALKLVRETDAGIVVSGRIGMHTSPPYAEDIYIGPLNGIVIGEHRASFIVPVGGSGVTTVCRKIAARHASPFIAPLSSRFDELDGQMWLDDVFIPWERVFFTEPTPEPVARWLLWHHLHGWLAKAEFTLGLGLACADALGLARHEPTIDYLVESVVDIATVRACLTASEHDPQFSAAGHCMPNYNHLLPGGIALFKARQRIAEILRIVPGSSLVVAPGEADLADPEIGPGLDASFAGGGYTAVQRSAVMQMAWDHVSSGLDGRESAFELHASGGLAAWRARLRRTFEDYDVLANAVVRMLGVAMPAIDLSHIRAAPLPPRRVNAPSPEGKAGEGKAGG